MKIEENNNFLTQYNRIGSKNSLSKDFFKKNQNSELDNNTHTEENDYSLPPFKRINNYVAPYRVKTNVDEVKDEETINKEIAEMQEKNQKVHEKKLEESKSLLEKLGIKGEVTGLSIETIPQNYTMYYVETSDEENIVIMELENGECVVGKTSLKEEQLFSLFDKFRDNNGFNNVKFNIEELKNLFMDFLIFGT